MQPDTLLALDRGTLVDGRYRLLGPIGRGGMAEVWLARHEELRQSVAIKFIDREMLEHAEYEAREEIIERFRFEAQVAAHLSASTPHVVAVRDAGTHEGLPFFVMEYVEGSTLESELQNHGPMSVERVATLLEQLAHALDAAHAMGVVHRDLKPANILLEAKDNGFEAKVADFGVAKALSARMKADRPRATVAGTLMGSPAYMSPEQIRGDLALDGRSDVWSLGVLAYEALTGALCFNHQGAQLAVAILTATPKPASSLRRGLPASVDAWFSRILSKSRDARFSSAGEAATAFRAALVPRKPATKRLRPSELAARVALAACLVASLLAGPLALAAVTDTHADHGAPAPVTSPIPAAPTHP